MVIHHDKLAYGKLALETEELSEKRIAEMLKLLNAGDGEQCEQKDEKSEEKRDK